MRLQLLASLLVYLGAALDCPLQPILAGVSVKQNLGSTYKKILPAEPDCKAKCASETDFNCTAILWPGGEALSGDCYLLDKASSSVDLTREIFVDQRTYFLYVSVCEGDKTPSVGYCEFLLTQSGVTATSAISFITPGATTESSCYEFCIANYRGQDCNAFVVSAERASTCTLYSSIPSALESGPQNLWTKTCSAPPVNCGYARWSEWTQCSVSCGNGTRTRGRTVATQPSQNGVQCVESEKSENGVCGTQTCNADCIYTDWTTFGACNATCASTGFRSRNRNIAREAQTGGVACSASAKIEVKVCASTEKCGPSTITPTRTSKSTGGVTRVTETTKLDNNIVSGASTSTQTSIRTSTSRGGLTRVTRTTKSGTRVTKPFGGRTSTTTFGGGNNGRTTGTTSGGGNGGVTTITPTNGGSGVTKPFGGRTTTTTSGGGNNGSTTTTAMTGSRGNTSGGSSGGVTTITPTGGATNECADPTQNTCDQNADCVDEEHGYSCQVMRRGFRGRQFIGFLPPGRVCNVQTKCPEQKTDLMFLIDGSGSIGLEVFNNEVLRFVREFVDLFDIGLDKTRVGLMQYSDRIRVQFELGEHADKASVLQAITETQYLQGSTLTGAAIGYMAREGFLESRGARPQSSDVARVAIVLTDGMSYDNVSSPAAYARTLSINTFAVGVTNHTNPIELESIAGSPDRWFHVDNFQDLNTRLRAMLQNATCSSEFVTPGTCNPKSQAGCDPKLNELCVEENLRSHCVCPDGVQRHPISRVCGGTLETQSPGGQTATTNSGGGSTEFTTTTATTGGGGNTTAGGNGASNECADPTHNKCDENADCIDEADGYSCQCSAGFVDVSSSFSLPPGRVCNVQTKCPEQKTDLMFLIDGSGSIGSEVFNNEVLRFVGEFVELFEIGLDQTRVGLIQYDGLIRQEFDLGQHTDKTSVLRAINATQYMNGSTKTGAAIEYMVQEGFSVKRGARPQSSDIARVAIVLTDGQSQDNVTPPATSARNLSIHIFAIGVTENVDASELEIIAGSPDRWFRVDKFKDLNTRLRAMLQNATCPPASVQSTTTKSIGGNNRSTTTTSKTAGGKGGTTTRPTNGGCCPRATQSLTTTDFADGLMTFAYNDNHCRKSLVVTCAQTDPTFKLFAAIVANNQFYLDSAPNSVSFRGTCNGTDLTWYMGRLPQPIAIQTLECRLSNPPST